MLFVGWSVFFFRVDAGALAFFVHLMLLCLLSHDDHITDDRNGCLLYFCGMKYIVIERCWLRWASKQRRWGLCD